MSRDREIVRKATLTETGLAAALARCFAGIEERVEKLEEAAADRTEEPKAELRWSAARIIGGGTSGFWHLFGGPFGAISGCEQHLDTRHPWIPVDGRPVEPAPCGNCAEEALHRGLPIPPLPGEPQDEPAASYDLVAHLYRQRAFSTRAFGPHSRTGGVLEHLRKELAEVEQNPNDLLEWIDLVLLALDGAWRRGFSPEQIAGALEAKQAKNEARTWPDWRTLPLNCSIEHVRADDPPPLPEKALPEKEGER